MHPPRVSNYQVLGVIRDLTIADQLPSGAALRAALYERFGSRGGVARIYRLLAAEDSRRKPPVEEGSVDALSQDIERLRAKLEESHAREDQYQSRWAQAVDALRMKVVESTDLAARLRILEESNKNLRHELQVTMQRAETLEERLFLITQSDERDLKQAGIATSTPGPTEPEQRDR